MSLSFGAWGGEKQKSDYACRSLSQNISGRGFESPRLHLTKVENSTARTVLARKMNKSIFLSFCCTLLFSTGTLAKYPEYNHFTINSDLHPSYVRLVGANAEAYYEGLAQQYFQRGWREPLTIYYSRTQSDTQKLLNEHGLDVQVTCGYYEPNTPAVYAHRFMDNTEPGGWGTLFHQITHHFVRQNFQNPPEWFDEGLACFLGEQTQIVKAKLIVTEPNPIVEKILKSKIDEGRGRSLRIKRLLSTSKESFYGWSVGPQFAQTLFYWLSENAQLQQYLKNVQKKGYEFPVLEETVSMPFGRINTELARFIRKNSYAAVHMEEGRQAENHAQKKEALLKALEIKPDYHPALLDLAKCYSLTKDNDKCRAYLEQILDDPQSCKYRQAAMLMGNNYYNHKDYAKAVGYYKKAWEYSDYYEYKYRLAHRIANCCNYLNDTETAAKWYEKFLDCNWEPEKTQTSIEYAREYVGRTNTPGTVQPDRQKSNNVDVEKKL